MLKGFRQVGDSGASKWPPLQNQTHPHHQYLALLLSAYSQPTECTMVVYNTSSFNIRTHIGSFLWAPLPSAPFFGSFARVWVPCKLVVAVDNLTYVMLCSQRPSISVITLIAIPPPFNKVQFNAIR